MTETSAPPAFDLIAVPTGPVLGPVTTTAGVLEAARLLEAGAGPVAVDAERASGYRYSQRAYLIQLARAGSGIILIDPVAVDDLGPVQDVLAGCESVLHAASQDLACLREVGLRPTRLFDTELAGRLLGLERVSLSAMLEGLLGLTLEKGHSAADWSTRPLPADWLIYAALDVHLLVELREAVAAELDRTGKREWAEQEFTAALNAVPPPPRVDPWRRTSGIHALRTRRQLAAVRALWEARDQIAMSRDIAPGRILPDSAIIAAARTDPSTAAAITDLPVFRGPRQRQHAGRWLAALAQARGLSESELPTSTLRGDGIPAPSRWRERDPAAAARLGAARAVVTRVAEEHHVQAQNLLAADLIRRLCWQPPAEVDADSVAAMLADMGARPWQIELCAAQLAEGLAHALATAPETVRTASSGTGPSDPSEQPDPPGPRDPH